MSLSLFAPDARGPAAAAAAAASAHANRGWRAASHGLVLAMREKFWAV